VIENGTAAFDLRLIEAAQSCGWPFRDQPCRYCRSQFTHDFGVVAALWPSHSPGTLQTSRTDRACHYRHRAAVGRCGIGSSRMLTVPSLRYGFGKISSTLPRRPLVWLLSLALRTRKEFFLGVSRLIPKAPTLPPQQQASSDPPTRLSHFPFVSSVVVAGHPQSTLGTTTLLRSRRSAGKARLLSQPSNGGAFPSRHVSYQ
jgi:hypothetical protein